MATILPRFRTLPSLVQRGMSTLAPPTATATTTTTTANASESTRASVQSAPQSAPQSGGAQPTEIILPGVYRPVQCEPASPTATRIPTAQILHPAERERVRSALRSLNRRSLSRPRSAAVLVPLCHVDGVPSVLFTVRASSLSSHSGEVRCG